MPVACEYPDLDDWTQIQDAELRKRVQNRLSQRRHREKIRKQNGGAHSSGRKARSDTASGQPDSTTASRSASPQTPSNTSSGSNLNNDGHILDTWDDPTGDNIGLDADWNDLTFLDGQALDHDTLYSFPGPQALPDPSPALPIRPQQLSLSTDVPRPCSCGAHLKGWMSDHNPVRFPQYQGVSNIPHLSAPGSLPPITLSNTPSLRIPSPVQVQPSPARACEPSSLSTRHVRAASEATQRPKIQRTITADSAIEMPASDIIDDNAAASSSNGSRKRARTTTPSDTTKVDPSLLESKPKDSNDKASAPPQDENSILREVSDMLSAIARDDAPSGKRQKRLDQVDDASKQEGTPSATNEETQISGSLPKIRRGTLPGGAQIIVIVMQP